MASWGTLYLTILSQKAPFACSRLSLKQHACFSILRYWLPSRLGRTSCSPLLVSSVNSLFLLSQCTIQTPSFPWVPVLEGLLHFCDSYGKGENVLHLCLFYWQNSRVESNHSSLQHRGWPSWTVSRTLSEICSFTWNVLIQKDQGCYSFCYTLIDSTEFQGTNFLPLMYVGITWTYFPNKVMFWPSSKLLSLGCGLCTNSISITQEFA